MEFIEMEKDLFLNEPPYAHCISSDFGMGAGIATIFNRMFDMKNELLKQFPNGWVDDNGKGYIGVIEHLGVYNLVTKEKFWNKPTYDNLEAALVAMRNKMILNGEEDISIPRIGCGLDGLEWGLVKEIIHRVFDATNITIYVCYI